MKDFGGQNPRILTPKILLKFYTGGRILRVKILRNLTPRILGTDLRKNKNKLLKYLFAELDWTSVILDIIWPKMYCFLFLPLWLRPNVCVPLVRKTLL